MGAIRVKTMPVGEERKMENKMYEAPCIVYEGDLEIQAGSPLSVIDDLDEFEF